MLGTPPEHFVSWRQAPPVEVWLHVDAEAVPAHRHIADDLCELGLLYAGIGDDSSAGRALDRAVEMYKATVGDDHPAAARCVRGFASRLHRAG